MLLVRHELLEDVALDRRSMSREQPFPPRGARVGLRIPEPAIERRPRLVSVLHPQGLVERITLEPRPVRASETSDAIRESQPAPPRREGGGRLTECLPERPVRVPEGDPVQRRRPLCDQAL